MYLYLLFFLSVDQTHFFPLYLADHFWTPDNVFFSAVFSVVLHLLYITMLNSQPHNPDGALPVLSDVK